VCVCKYVSLFECICSFVFEHVRVCLILCLCVCVCLEWACCLKDARGS
jgi:hypothetical protein